MSIYYHENETFIFQRKFKMTVFMFSLHAKRVISYYMYITKLNGRPSGFSTVLYYHVLLCPCMSVCELVYKPEARVE